MSSFDWFSSFSFATYLAKQWNLWVDYWLPYDQGRYAPDVKPLQCNGPNTTWHHEANLDCAVCYKTHHQYAQYQDCLTWWFCCRRRTWTCGRRDLFSRWNSFYRSSHSLHSPFSGFFPPNLHRAQVPSDKVQIRTNSEGVQMVFGTCPILVEGNEYIFRCRINVIII